MDNLMDIFNKTITTFMNLSVILQRFFIISVDFLVINSQ